MLFTLVSPGGGDFAGVKIVYSVKNAIQFQYV